MTENIELWAEAVPEFLEQSPCIMQAVASGLEIVDPEESVSSVDRIHRHLEEMTGKVYGDRALGYYHPSEIGYCMLAASMSRTKEPGVYNKAPKSTLILEFGQAAHDFLQWMFLGTYGGHSENKKFLKDAVWETILELRPQLAGLAEYELFRDLAASVSDFRTLCRVFDVVPHEFGARLLQKAEEHVLRTGEELFLFELPLCVGSLWIEGTCDGVILSRKDLGGGVFRVRKRVVEIKTIKTLSGVTRPKLEHLFQVHIYMVASGAAEYTVVYLDKTKIPTMESVFKDFPGKFDFGIWAAVVNRIAGSEARIRAGRRPDPDTGMGCQDCSWIHKCPGWAGRSGRELSALFLEGGGRSNLDE